MKRLLGRLVVLLLIGFTGFVIRSSAQTASTGALNGRVTDPSGGVVPGATVTVISQATGAQRDATTGSDGTYLIPLLPPGEYQVKVSKNGFETALFDNVSISVTETRTTNVSLEIGTVNQTVAVS